MKVTIKDVAKEANVAVSTVSRVLSNSGKISEKTKEKVWAAVKKLNYVLVLHLEAVKRIILMWNKFKYEKGEWHYDKKN